MAVLGNRGIHELAHGPSESLVIAKADGSCDEVVCLALEFRVFDLGCGLFGEMGD